MLTALFLLTACKKTEPEVAAEPAPPPIDASTSVTVKVPEGTTKVRLVCKDTGTKNGFEVSGDQVLVTGLDGEQCSLFFMPGEKKFGPVSGGTSLTCVNSGDDGVSCKEL